MSLFLNSLIFLVGKLGGGAKCPHAPPPCSYGHVGVVSYRIPSDASPVKNNVM